MIKDLIWQNHHTNTRPISEELYIVYKTEGLPNETLSHIHMPAMARDINWQRTDEKNKIAPKIGKIARYAVVKKPKLK